MSDDEDLDAHPDNGDRPPTTLDATLRQGPGGRYRRLVWGPGEPHLERDDLGVGPDPDRKGRRASLLYFAHHTDVHLCDAQSPSRLEMGERLAWLAPGTDAGHRPQEHATVQVFDQMVRAVNSVRTSPASGAPMAFCIGTGDNTDNRQYGELRWFIDTLDGGSVTPNTGGADYDGVQAWGNVGWVYHPEDPSGDPYGRFGFPRLPGLLTSSTRPFETAGSVVPWLVVLGNHDVIWQGSFGNRTRRRWGEVGDVLSTSGTKPAKFRTLATALAAGSLDQGRLRAGIEDFATRHSVVVTPDPVARRPLTVAEQVAEFFVTSTEPGPLGHGFTDANVADGTAYWARPHGERFLLVGLDTNNHSSGSEGRMGPRQLRWLETQLEAAGRGGRLVVVFSHHNSLTMTNSVEDHDDPGPATGGGELVDLFGRHRQVVLWVNGHDHQNRILHHRDPRSDGGGFWEICTASCIDFGQQSRTIEIFDNDDGTLSIVATVLDHAAPPSVALRGDGCYSPAEVASLSRELAANDALWIDPWEQRGRAEDRNVELLVRAPRPPA